MFIFALFILPTLAFSFWNCTPCCRCRGHYSSRTKVSKYERNGFVSSQQACGKFSAVKIQSRATFPTIETWKNIPITFDHYCLRHGTSPRWRLWCVPWLNVLDLLSIHTDSQGSNCLVVTCGHAVPPIHTKTWTKCPMQVKMVKHLEAASCVACSTMFHDDS